MANRLCDECGETYGRCNKVAIWVKQNPGHVFGWIKIVRNVCTKCMPEARVRSMIHRVRAYFGPTTAMLPTPSMMRLAMRKPRHKRKGN